MRGPRFVVVPLALVVLAVLVPFVAMSTGCTPGAKPPAGPTLADRLDRLERENRALKKSLEELQAAQDRARWLPQKVHSLESKFSVIEHRLSRVERR